MNVDIAVAALCVLLVRRPVEVAFAFAIDENFGKIGLGGRC